MERRKFLAFFGLLPAGVLGLKGNVSMLSGLAKSSDAEPATQPDLQKSMMFLTCTGIAASLKVSCQRAIKRQSLILRNIDSQNFDALNLSEADIAKFETELEQKLSSEFNVNVGSFLTESELQEGIRFFSSEAGKKISAVYERLQLAGTPVIDEGSTELRNAFINKLNGKG